MTAAKATAADIAAIGVTNQRETTILWERDTGKPVANAIVWQSRISAPICERLKKEGCEKVFRQKTGLVLDPYFSGTKIRHLLDNVSGLRQRAERGEVLFGTVDSFLIWRLTGGKRHVTDVSNASRTLLAQYPHAAVGRRAAETHGRAAGDAARGPAVEPRYGDVRSGRPGRADPHRGRRGRPTSRDLRSGLLRARHGQEHLWHRLLHAAQRR